jgi:virginiamycin B lyase
LGHGRLNDRSSREGTRDVDFRRYLGSLDKSQMKGRKTQVAPILMAGLLALGLVLSLAGKTSAAVYWGNGSPIGRVNLDGTEAQYEFIKYVPFSSPGAAAVSGCGGVAVDASHVFWAEPSYGSIGRANLDGSGADYTFITGAENPCGLAVDGGHVYWSNFSGGSIGRANLDGSNATQSFITSVGQPCGVAVDRKFIYWTSATASYVGRALVDTGDKGPHLVDGDGSFEFCGLAVDQTHLFWGGFGDRIGRVNLDGSDPDPSFISGVERPCGIAVDPSHVYWSAQWGPEGIGVANLDGTALDRYIITGLTRHPCGIAVDGVSVTHPQPPPRSEFDFGKVTHIKKKAVTFVPIDFPDAGYFRAKVTSGAAWTLLPERVKGGILSTGGRKWLKLWAGGKGGNGKTLRRRLRQRGRASIVIEAEYSAAGHAPTIKGKRVQLVKSD